MCSLNPATHPAEGCEFTAATMSGCTPYPAPIIQHPAPSTHHPAPGTRGHRRRTPQVDLEARPMGLPTQAHTAGQGWHSLHGEM